MMLPLTGGLPSVMGVLDDHGGWLYDLLTKAGVDPSTAQSVNNLVVRPFAILVVAIVGVLAAKLGSKAIRRILQGIADKAAARSGSPRAGARLSTMSALSANVWRFFVFVIAVAIILGIVGINLAPLLASATIIGATVGFGAQLIVRDYFSGFLLTVEDQFGIGDSVTIGMVTGVVEDQTLRVTRIRDDDGTVYFVANGDIRVLANTSRGWAHAVVDLTLPGSSANDLPRARGVIEEAARRVAAAEAFAGLITAPTSLVTFIDSTDTTLTLRVTLHTVPSKRNVITRALREEAVVALSGAALWPADAGSPDPPSVPAPA